MTEATEWTIGRLLDWTRRHLEERGLDESRLCAELLLAEALACRRIELYTRFGESPTETQRSAFRELVRRAASAVPIAYLIGRKEFYSLDFQVTPDVLIPRPESELLVERALAWCREHPRERIDVLDVGTGSGCLAISIAVRCPAAQVVASDVSAAALEVARGNAARHGVEGRVRLIEADLLSLPDAVIPSGGFDVLVSNPPYVAEADRAALPPNVRDHEPAIALFAGADGLGMFRRIAADLGRVLRPDGIAVLEIGHNQADAVADLLCQVNGEIILGGRYRDLHGVERVLEVRKRT